MQVPTSKASLPLDNKLLASLPREHFDLLLPNLVSVNLPQALALAEAGDEVDQSTRITACCALSCCATAKRQCDRRREGAVGAITRLGAQVTSSRRGADAVVAARSRQPAGRSPPAAIRFFFASFGEILLSQAR